MIENIVSNVALIEGVILTPLRQINDDRGAVLHMLRHDAPEFKGFGECYFSEIRPGVIKAWNRHRLQTQTLAVPAGQIRMVIYDDREDSSTKGNLQELQMGRPDAYFRLQIPPNLWYGFSCVGDTAALLVNCADMTHDPLERDFCSIVESTIPYDWK